jgi:hypothetical protein
MTRKARKQSPEKTRPFASGNEVRLRAARPGWPNIRKRSNRNEPVEAAHRELAIA